MKYTFHCKACHKHKLVDSKEELEEEKKKHWIGEGHARKHVDPKQTMMVEMRTSKRSGRSYPILVAQ